MKTLGVVIVTYNSTDVILDCLESLLSTTGTDLYVVVVDNDSPDGTAGFIERWAAGNVEYTPAPDIPIATGSIAKPIPLNQTGPGLTLIRSGRNGGFAAGVNVGLAHLSEIPEVDRFWVLNPDCVVTPDAPAAFANWPAPEGGFSLLGGRIIYLETPDQIQSDGGRVNMTTGVTGNIHLGAPVATTRPPDLSDIGFIAGANLVASRQFYETAGPMHEDFFLYYEEVDWCMRRGDLPLGYCSEGIVYHRAGSSIGSPTLERSGSAFSTYYLYRARMMFMRRHRWWMLPVAYGYAMAKAGQMMMHGRKAEARALLRGIHGMPLD
ncbi:glycosyltransferase family 2 protein [Arenibacterium sp. CAU 1754]